MNKLLITTAIAGALIAFPGTVSAATQTCVTQYGGGVVCGVETPTVVHTPVRTASGDVNMIVLTAVSFAAAGFAFFKYRKEKAI
jgi:hypothetical protein